MMKCIFCEESAEIRKYFIEDIPLCDSDYIGYLETLIKGDVTPKDAIEAYKKYKLCRPPTAKEVEQKKQIKLEAKRKQEKIDAEQNKDDSDDYFYHMQR